MLNRTHPAIKYNGDAPSTRHTKVQLLLAKQNRTHAFLVRLPYVLGAPQGHSDDHAAPGSMRTYDCTMCQLYQSTAGIG